MKKSSSVWKDCELHVSRVLEVCKIKFLLFSESEVMFYLDANDENSDNSDDDGEVDVLEESAHKSESEQPADEEIVEEQEEVEMIADDTKVSDQCPLYEKTTNLGTGTVRVVLIIENVKFKIC